MMARKTIRGIQRGHSFLSHNGKAKNVLAKCVKCGLVRDYTNYKKMKYYRDGINYETNQDCIK